MEALEQQLQTTQQPQAVMAQAEAARAMQEVQAALVIAKKFPRDEVASETRIMTSCKRYSLAEEAVYSFPRGGEAVSGPSIRLAEMLARNWGNVQYGFRELDQEQGKSTVEAYCHDLETNTRVSRVFMVQHRIGTKKGVKILTDERDIYEKVANNAQRRVRAAILEIIPGDVVEKAVRQCQTTLKAGPKDVPLIDQIKTCVQVFNPMGVSQEMLEKRLGHPIANTTLEEMAELRAIFNSMRDKHSSREEWFSVPQATTQGGLADVVAKVAEETAKAETAAKNPEPKPAEPPQATEAKGDQSSFEDFQ